MTRRFRRILRFALAAAVPAVVLAAPRDARAQGWLKDRGYTEGEGIRTGDVELHPGIGAEIGYDSNWFLRTHREGEVPGGYVNGAPSNPPTDAAVMRITPSFSISTLGQARLMADPASARERPAFQFRGTVSSTLYHFFGKKEVADQSTINAGNVAFDASVRADFNAGRPVGFALLAGYNRLIQPNVVSDPNRSFNRNNIRGGGEVIFLPGGGALDIRAGYQAQATLFETSNGAPFNYITHELAFRDRWRFRPRTALFHDTTLRFVNYPNADRSFNFLNDAAPLRTRFGLTGLVTERISTLLAIGYGTTFFQSPASVSSIQYNNFLANAELTYALSGDTGASEPGQVSLLLSSISLGYQRDFSQSFLGNFYTSDKIYTRFRYLFGGRAIIDLTADAERLAFPQPFVNNGGVISPAIGPNGAVGEFDNWLVGGAIFGEYRFSNRFGINTTIDYHQMISDTAVPAGSGAAAGPAAPNFFHLSWRRFQAFIGVRYFF
jgi:hypothetical protein